MFIKRGQVGLEFMLVTGVAFFTLIIFVVVLSHITAVKQEEKAMYMAEDLVLSLKQEINFASNAEQGYFRLLDLPNTIEGYSYEIILGTTAIGTGYFELIVNDVLFFEIIPRTFGEIRQGKIRISKQEDHVLAGVVQ